MSDVVVDDGVVEFQEDDPQLWQKNWQSIVAAFQHRQEFMYGEPFGLRYYGPAAESIEGIDTGDIEEIAGVEHVMVGRNIIADSLLQVWWLTYFMQEDSRWCDVTGDPYSGATLAESHFGDGVAFFGDTTNWGACFEELRTVLAELRYKLLPDTSILYKRRVVTGENYHWQFFEYDIFPAYKFTPESYPFVQRKILYDAPPSPLPAVVVTGADACHLSEAPEWETIDGDTFFGGASARVGAGYYYETYTRYTGPFAGFDYPYDVDVRRYYFWDASANRLFGPYFRVTDTRVGEHFAKRSAVRFYLKPGLFSGSGTHVSIRLKITAANSSGNEPVTVHLKCGDLTAEQYSESPAVHVLFGANNLHDESVVIPVSAQNTVVVDREVIVPIPASARYIAWEMETDPLPAQPAHVHTWYFYDGTYTCYESDPNKYQFHAASVLLSPHTP